MLGIPQCYQVFKLVEGITTDGVDDGDFVQLSL